MPAKKAAMVQMRPKIEHANTKPQLLTDASQLCENGIGRSKKGLAGHYAHTCIMGAGYAKLPETP